MSTLYDVGFYRDQQDGSQRSARQTMPLLLTIFAPKSVVDVGCGVGTWLAVLRELGVTDVLGLDGDYVDRSMLRIPAEQFIPADLRQAIPTDRRFDLALCLEVAEHLSKDTGSRLIAYLTSLAPVVVFSAAIPGQGGTDHVNEQWQDYWRAAFSAQGYTALDLVRPHVWRNEAVDFWYRQNLIVYASLDAVARHGLTPVPDETSLNLVHPKLLALARDEGQMYLSKALAMIPRLARQSLKRRLG